MRRPGARADYRWYGFGFIATTIPASSPAFIGGSVVSVWAAAIGWRLHADAVGLQWVVNNALLPLKRPGSAGRRERRPFRPAVVFW